MDKLEIQEELTPMWQELFELSIVLASPDAGERRKELCMIRVDFILDTFLDCGELPRGNEH